jgi:sirohydrochlorin ferrochelatase
MKTGILLFAHGSPVEEANRGVHELAEKIAAAGPYCYVRAAFLDSTQPDLLARVMEAAKAGSEFPRRRKTTWRVIGIAEC